MAISKNLISSAKTKFDLTDPADQNSLYVLTGSLLDSSLRDLQAEAFKANAPLELRLATKLVQSRQFMLSNEQPAKIGVVFAMWGEQNRLRPKSDDNPNGEDSLRVKLEQLQWITKDTPIEWTLYAVDDGCPHGSGKLAEEIAAEHPLGEHVRVLYLEEAIPTDDPALAPLKSVSESRKGGAIILGCKQAIVDGADAVIYTDADNSVHLGQLGLLLKPFLAGEKVVLGNRKDPEAVLVKQEARWGIGIKVLRHMQRMVGRAIFSRDIRDTQAAFKLYDAVILGNILQKPTVYDFSFDTDWILAVIAMNQPFYKIPFAFIDSAAESASVVQGPMTTWETLLLGLVKAVRAREVDYNEAMAQVIDEEISDYQDLELLINHLPEQLEKALDKDLGNPEVMSPAELQAWIKERKAEAQ